MIDCGRIDGIMLIIPKNKKYLRDEVIFILFWSFYQIFFMVFPSFKYGDAYSIYILIFDGCVLPVYLFNQ